MNNKKKMPIGVSDFKEIISGNYYYVDKSLFVKEIIDDGSKVVLIPRPRRFGKTLNLSMLRYFFDVNEDVNLFEGLKVWENEEYRSERGKYPVVFITFKDVKNDTFVVCMRKIRALVSAEIRRFKYLFDSNKIEQEDALLLSQLSQNKASDDEFESALLLLSRCLEAHHGQKTIILIDEYDMPIQGGYINDYYDKITGFMRNFLSAGFKDNIYLHKGVMTGILRIAKESIFSGLNNLSVATIMDTPYSDRFGLLEDEVEVLLNFFGNGCSCEIVKEWYNGYVFGKNTIYNPWSILNFVNNRKEIPEPYWINTSSNDIIRSLITKGSGKLKEELEDLMNGASITKEINSNIVMQDIDKSTNSIWNFMLFSGYLKPVEQVVIPGSVKTFFKLKIPNLEVSYLFENIISSWFNETLRSDDFEFTLKSLLNGEFENFEDNFRDYVLSSFSFFDTAGESEKTYHAFVLGMLISLPKDQYSIKSNRESGFGRYDVMVVPTDKKRNGIIIEFKKVNKKRNETLEIAIDSAFSQMEKKKYRHEMQALDIHNIFEVAIAIDGKDARVEGRKIS